MPEAEVPARFGSYVRGRELGRGASGTVFACELRTGDGSKTGAQVQTFAAKAIDLRRLRLSAKADRELKKLQREVDILKRVPPHPNVVRFIDSLEEGTWFFFVLEFVGGGDLFSALVRRPAAAGKRPRFREAEATYILGQLVDGLSFLHAHGVIHRDLKLENLLVVQERKLGPNILCDVKITDFGLSKVVGDGMSVAHSTVGSPRYIAPEVLARGVHDFRADLWSLGVLLYVLLAGRFPIDGPPESVSQATVTAALAKLEASDAAKQVINGLLQIDLEKRMTLDDLRRHPWAVSALTLDDPPAKRPRAEEPAADSIEVGPDTVISCHSTIELFCSEDAMQVEEAETPAKPAVAVPPAPPMPTCRLPGDCGVDASPAVVVDGAAETPPSTLRRPPLTGVVVPARPRPEAATGGAGPRVVPAKARAPPGQTDAAAESHTMPCDAEEVILSIREADAPGPLAVVGAVRGTVLFRSDHKVGGGFHLRLRDADGEMIDVRFWDTAAAKFREDLALSKGADLLLSGFRRRPLSPKELPFAPPNRAHALSYNVAEQVRYRCEPAPA